MLVQSILHVIGKLENPREKDGNTKIFYSINYTQNDGKIIGNIPVSAETYAQLETGKSYTFDAEYKTWNNNGYISIIGIHNANMKGGTV